MPEVYEYATMVAHVRPQVVGMQINNVASLGTPFGGNIMNEKEINKEKKLNSLELPCTITDIQSCGKEIMLLTDSNSIKISFCQGAYICFIDDLKLLLEEPYRSEAFAGFYGIKDGKQGAFLIVDVHIFRHQSTFTIFEDGKLHWSNQERKRNGERKLGPCVLNENKEFQLHFKEQLERNPEYFKSHSIAYILCDEFLCYGYGEYTVSELLHRFYNSFSIKPWDIAYDCFQKEGFLETFLAAPLIMFEEQKLYWKGYNPAMFKRPQVAARTEFRLHFLGVYGKKRAANGRVTPFAIYTKKGVQGIWTSCLEDEREIPLIITKKHYLKSVKPPKGSLLNVVSESLRETESWHRFRGRLSTKETIGVGLHDWHSPNLAKEYKLNQEAAKIKEKLSVNANGKRKRNKKYRKQSGLKKMERNLKFVYRSGLAYSNLAEKPELKKIENKWCLVWEKRI